MVVRSGRLISDLEANPGEAGVNGGRWVARPPSWPLRLTREPLPCGAFDPGMLGDVRPAELGARRHVEIPLPDAAEIRPLGEEVQRRAIERERRGTVEGRAVDGRAAKLLVH